MPRPTALLTVAALTGALLTALAAPGHAAASCATTWGSTPEQVVTGSGADLVGVRAGRHACFDRLVLEVGRGPLAGYAVAYVPHVTQDGSGDVIPTRGGAALQVLAHVPAYDDAGRTTYAPADPAEVVGVAGFRTFRQVVWGSSNEGDSTLGIGVRARLPFRVLALPGPGDGSRLVVDVAHRW